MKEINTDKILNALPLKYYILRLDDKILVQSNDPMVRTGEEQCFRQLFKKEYPCHPAGEGCICEQVKENGRPAEFVEEQEDDNRKKYFRYRITNLEDNLLLLTKEDCTEELRAKREIRINTKRLERAERLVDFGYWEFRIDNKLVRSSQGAQKIYGIEEELIPLEEVQKVPLPEYREKLDKSLHELIYDQKPYNVRFKIRRKNDQKIRFIHSIAEYRADKKMVFGVISDITGKTESENALEESLIDLKLAQQIAKVGNWKYDPAANDLKWSDEIYEIFERNKQDGPLLPEKHPDFYSEKDCKILEKATADAINRGISFELQFKLCLKDSEKWVEVICQPDESKGPAGYYLRGTIQDITATKQTEDELNHTNKLLRTLIDIIPDSIYMKDVNLRKLLANKGDAEHCGVENVEDIIGKSDYDIYPREIADVYTKDDKIVIETGEQIINREEVLPGEDGARWILTSKIPLKNNEDKIVGLVGIGRDITEFKRQESQLRLFKQTIDQSPLSVIITNTKGEVEYVNQGFTKITGYSYEEVVGKQDDFLKSEKQDEASYRALQAAVSSGKNWNGELYCKKKDGQFYWERVIIAPVFDDNQEIKHFVSINEDISEKKQMIQELEIARDKAEESDKLKSLFLANMSHEIRTPLNGILGFSNVICSGGEEDPERLEYYKTIIENCGQRLVTVIDDIIDISMIQSNQLKIVRKDFDINELLEEVYVLYQEQKAEQVKKIEFKVGFCENPDHKTVFSDKNRIFQVLKNLLDNAFKFTEIGFIEFGCSESNQDELILYVEDSGIGIDKSKNKIIFESFRQAEEGNSRKYDGSGLGLAITSGIIERLGGKIWIQSEVGMGSVFYISLPRGYKKVADERNNQTENLQDVTAISGTKKRILSIEDDKASIEYLKSVASAMGYELINFDNAQEGLKYLNENQVDLVLMDIQLPEMNGYEATRQIKADFPNMPIIVQTAYAMKGDEEKAFEAGCDEYLVKPVGLKNLREKIAKYIADNN